MSFVRAPEAKATNSTFQLSLVPDPTQKFTEQQGVAQRDVINQITQVSKGLFHPNPAVEVDGALKSQQHYSKGVPMADIAQAMQEYKLVMRVNLSGDHKSCAMATADDLLANNLIKSPTGSFSLNSGKYITSVDFL